MSPPRAAPRRGLWRWLRSTSNRTFVLWPLLLLAAQALLDGGWPQLRPWALPLLGLGWAQYRACGRWRSRRGGGGPGIANPPLRLVEDGPYAVLRNPMYLGHLVFYAGLALLFPSGLGWPLLAWHAWWFDRRVREDERQLQSLFGPRWTGYADRVRRWLPRWPGPRRDG